MAQPSSIEMLNCYYYIQLHAQYDNVVIVLLCCQSSRHEPKVRKKIDCECEKETPCPLHQPEISNQFFFCQLDATEFRV